MAYADIISTTIIYIIAGVAVLGVIWLVIFIKSFKHTFSAKIQTGGKFIHRTFKCREATDKETKNIFWYPLQKGVKKFAKPNEEQLYHDYKKRGQLYSEGVVNKEGEVIAFFEFESEKDTLGLLQRYRVKTFDNEQRIGLVNQFKKAELKRNAGFWSKYGTAMLGMGFIIVLAIMFMIFWGDMIEPLKKETQANREFMLEFQVNMLNITKSLETTAKVLAQTTSEKQYVN